MKMNIQTLHETFCQEARLIRNNSPATIAWYKVSLKGYLKYHGGLILSLEQITTDNLREYLYSKRNDGSWTPDSFLNQYKGIKLFFKWCVKHAYLQENPMDDIERPKLSRKLPKRLTSQDALRVIEYSFNMKTSYRFERYRNRAVFAMMVYSGLRANEVLSLKMAEVDVINRVLNVNNGKGGKDRIVPISPMLIRYLDEYILDKKRMGKDSEYFFTSVASGLPLPYKSVAKICKKISKSCGVSFTPHCLRHTFGSVAIEQGIGLPQLKEIMGHSEITSTMIYVKMSSKCLNESLNKVELF